MISGSGSKFGEEKADSDSDTDNAFTAALSGS
jgi:hypothetical protein